MGGTESSSDLDLGRRPELESDEFSVPPIVVIEKISLLCLKPLNRCGSFWEPDPIRDSFGNRCDTVTLVTSIYHSVNITPPAWHLCIRANILAHARTVILTTWRRIRWQPSSYMSDCRAVRTQSCGRTCTVADADRVHAIKANDHAT